MLPGRTFSSGIPYWSVDTVLSVQLLSEFVDRLERRCSNRAAEESVYARLLRACGISGALEQGRRVHVHVQRHADDRSLFFGNRLVNMYRRCGSLEEARNVFDQMRERDVVSWTAMISAYAQTGHQRQALDLFTEMTRNSLEPNRVTYLALLEACSSPEFLEDGKEIHARVLALRMLETDTPVANAVMGMYRKCARSDLAMNVFRVMRDRDLVSWNNAIAANAEAGDHVYTLTLLKKMQLEGVTPDKVTFVSSLTACIGSKSLIDGRMIHSLVLERAMEGDVVLGTALVTMYGRCGCLDGAREIFQRMPERNVVSWNAMIASCIQSCEDGEAFDLFRRMTAVAGLEPTRVSFITILNAVATPEALAAEGRRIHALIEHYKLLSHVEVGNALVTMYGRCGSVADAETVFFAMQTKDIVSWNAMLSAYAQSSLSREVIGLFHRMRSERIPPDRITFLTVFDACAELRDLETGRTVHYLSVESGFGSCISVANATMHLYSSCYSPNSPSTMEKVVEIFESMPARDVISWNTMITSYIQAGDSASALLIFKRMLVEGIRGNQVTFMSLLSVCDSPTLLREGEAIHRSVIDQTPDLCSDPLVVGAAVNMYGKCGELDTARQLFEQKKIHRSLASWNSMISAYALHGRAEQAFELSERMRREGVVPDRVTFLTLLNACVVGGAVRQGKIIHARIVDSGLDADPVVANALVNFYSKSGNLDTALSLFETLEQRDVVSWNGIIAGLAHNGHARDAIKTMWLMQQDGVRPDAITFLSVLSASSHGGFLRQGGDDFVAMAVDHELERGVEHYGCMIDLLGRSGRIGDAEYFVGSMRDEDKEVSWMTLLSACEVQGDEERAERVAGSIVELNPQHSSAYIALSNLYATGGSFRFKKPKLKKRSVL